MGNNALRELAVLNETTLDSIAGQRAAIDAHQWLHKYIRAITRYTEEDLYTTADGEEVPNIVALLQGIPPLLRRDITPIFVFDGEPPDRKQDTLDERQKVKEKAEEKMKEAAKRGDMEAMRKHKAQTQSLTPIIHQTTRTLLDTLGVPYVEAGGPGEAYAAELVQNDFADVTVTEDYDALLFGSPITIRQYSGDGPAEQMLFHSTLAEHEINHEDLVNIALLCGTDFNDGVRGIGPKRGLKYISNGKTLEEIQEDKDHTIDGVDELQSLFLDPPTNDMPQTQPKVTNFARSSVKSFCTDWDIPESFADEKCEKFPSSA